MINLSAFIQFIGALYLSIAIDSTLFKRFWNPDFFTMMSSNIKHYTNDNGVNISTELSNKLTDTAKNTSNKIDANSRMQGCMMLIYSVALLVALGFRNNFDGVQINTASLSMFVFVLSLNPQTFLTFVQVFFLKSISSVEFNIMCLILINYIYLCIISPSPNRGWDVFFP